MRPIVIGPTEAAAIIFESRIRDSFPQSIPPGSELWLCPSWTPARERQSNWRTRS